MGTVLSSYSPTNGAPFRYPKAVIRWHDSFEWRLMLVFIGIKHMKDDSAVDAVVANIASSRRYLRKAITYCGDCISLCMESATEKDPEKLKNENSRPLAELVQSVFLYLFRFGFKSKMANK